MSQSPSEKSSFYEILLEKMAKNTDSRVKNDPQNSKNVIFESESVLFSSEKHHFSPPLRAKYTSFHVKKTSSKAPNTEQKQHSPPQTKSENSPRIALRSLSTASQITLLALAPHLVPADDFDGTVCAKSIKRAYRQKARELHPDLNAKVSGAEFATFKTSADALMNEIRAILRADATTTKKAA